VALEVSETQLAPSWLPWVSLENCKDMGSDLTAMLAQTSVALYPLTLAPHRTISAAEAVPQGSAN